MKNIEYIFTEEDFKNAFSFAVNIYLSKGPHTGRTSGEPRGLGAVLDAFTRGKLIEIAVKKILEKINPYKKIILDFDMKAINQVAEEADIIKVNHNNKSREPNLFIEIKNTSVDDRWIGLTEEQLTTMEKGSKNKEIVNIYASLHSVPLPSNPSSSDFVGMYLKHISGLPIFNGFAPLNAFAKLEFIISSKDLYELGAKFPKGELLYETDLFPKISRIRKKDGSLLKRIKKIGTFSKYSGTVSLCRENDGLQDDSYGRFKIHGSYNLYRKTNEKSLRDYIETISDVKVSNDIFGEFILSKNNIFSFNLITCGRDPVLKRNNIWIAKRRVYQLINKGIISEPHVALRKISEKI